MANPTAIIDHCLSPTKQWFFALEADKIWRAEHIGAIAKPTWQHVMTALDGATFHRMVAPTFGTVYVLATKPGAVNNDAVMYKTVNNGLTWSTHDIASDIGLGRSYTVDHYGPEEKEISSGKVTFDFEITRRADPDNEYSPYGMATYLTPPTTGWHALYTDDYTVQLGGESSNMDGTRAAVNRLYGAKTDPTVCGWFDEYFGTGNWAHYAGSAGHQMPKEDARTHIRFGYHHSATGPTIKGECWVFYNIQEPVSATALAAAPSNGSWIYVGFREQIVMTKNAGVDWEVVTDAYGAYDIAVNPLLAGVITFWTPDGDLRQAIAGEVGAALLTETPLQQAHRIAYSRDNGGKLWVLANAGATCDLKLYTGGAWATKQTGISGAAGLNTYVKGSGLHYVLYLSGDKIYYSENDGTDVADKIGDWSGYASPVRIDML